MNRFYSEILILKLQLILLLKNLTESLFYKEHTCNPCFRIAPYNFSLNLKF